MKKIIKRLLATTACLIFAGVLLTGCGSGTDVPAEPITITFMDGKTTLGTVETYQGNSLKTEDYKSFETKTDYEFLGWFETPSFLESSQKDPATYTFEESTTLYASFKKTKVTEDTRKWYLAGYSAAGPLKDNNWAGDISAELKESFELKLTGNVTNEFQITIDLFKGDQFQLIHDWSWDGQMGYGYFTSIDETQFECGGSLGGSTSKANVNVIMDGNYTITLTTDPDNAALNTLVVVRNGDPLTEANIEEVEPFKPSDKTVVKVKGSWVADWSELKDLTRTEGTNTYTITMDLAADIELCFSVFEGEEDTGIVLKEENVTDDASKAIIAQTGNNIKTVEAGSYTFTVDLDAMTVTVTK